QMFNALNCRSEDKSLFKIGFLRNKPFLISVAICLFGQFLLIYVPFFQTIFATEELYLSDLILILCVCMSVLFYEEIVKYFIQRKQNRGEKRKKSLEQVYVI